MKQRRIWSDSDRVDVGRRHRDAEPDNEIPTAPRRKPAIEAVPEFRTEEPTSPIHLLDPARAQRRRPNESVQELAAQLRRDTYDAYDLIATMAFELKLAKERSADAPSAEAVAELRRDVEAIKRKHAIAGKLVLALCAGLVSALLYVANAISAASELRGSTAARMQALEQTVHDLMDQLWARRKDSP